MSILSNKLHVKGTDGTVYDCNCYTTMEEATPIGHSCWNIRNNGIECYVGLWETSVPVSGTNYHTPLKIKKGGKEYFIETKVENYIDVTIKQTPHQTITVTNDGQQHTTNFKAKVKSNLTWTLSPEVGYEVGSVTVNGKRVSQPLVVGYENLSFTASTATLGSHLVEIEQQPNQTIIINCNGEDHISNFRTDYGTSYTAKVVPAEGYIAGTLNQSATGKVTGPLKFSATAPTLKTFPIRINTYDNQKIHVYVNGVDISSKPQPVMISWGSEYTASVVPSEGYIAGALTQANRGVIKSDITFTAAPAIIKTYKVKLIEPNNAMMTATHERTGSTYTAPDEFIVNYGDSVTVDVTPNTYYEINRIETSSNNLIEFIIENNPNVDIYVNDILIKPGILTYPFGTRLNIRATPKEGYNLIDATIDGQVVSIIPDYEFTLSDKTTLAVNTAIKTYDIHIYDDSRGVVKAWIESGKLINEAEHAVINGDEALAIASGEIPSDAQTAPCDLVANHGDTLFVHAEPNKGFLFKDYNITLK